MTTASTQLRALEGEIEQLIKFRFPSISFERVQRLLTIAKELEAERDAKDTLLISVRNEAGRIENIVASLRTENATLKRRLDEAKRAVADEPELPGDMPDEMWDAIKGDRDAMNEALKLTVRLTKQNILHRITEIDKL